MKLAATTFEEDSSQSTHIYTSPFELVMDGNRLE